MDGIQNYRAWRWIFILEGVFTCFGAFGAYFVLPDWPDTAKFLNEEERSILLRRLAEDGGEAQMETLTKKAVKRILVDPKIYLG